MEDNGNFTFMMGLVTFMYVFMVFFAYLSAMGALIQMAWTRIQASAPVPRAVKLFGVMLTAAELTTANLVYMCWNLSDGAPSGHGALGAVLPVSAAAEFLISCIGSLACSLLLYPLLWGLPDEAMHRDNDEIFTALPIVLALPSGLIGIFIVSILAYVLAVPLIALAWLLLVWFSKESANRPIVKIDTKETTDSCGADYQSSTLSPPQDYNQPTGP